MVDQDWEYPRIHITEGKLVGTVQRRLKNKSDKYGQIWGKHSLKRNKTDKLAPEGEIKTTNLNQAM